MRRTVTGAGIRCRGALAAVILAAASACACATPSGAAARRRLVTPESLGYQPADRSCLSDGMVEVATSLSPAELSELLTLIRSRDKRVVTRIQEFDGPGEYLIETGVDCGFASGDGYTMIVRRTPSGWEVVIESPWEA